MMNIVDNLAKSADLILSKRLEIISGISSLCMDGKIEVDVDILAKCNNDTENIKVSVTHISFEDGMLKLHALTEFLDLVYIYQDDLSIDALMCLAYGIKNSYILNNYKIKRLA